jgi:hypothetical protein
VIELLMPLNKNGRIAQIFIGMAGVIQGFRPLYIIFRPAGRKMIYKEGTYHAAAG